MDKELEYKIRANFAEALNRFDFAKVYDVMNYLDWCWHDEKHSPSQAQMIEMVENELFEYAINNFKGKEINTFSGGFTIRIYPGGKVSIEFVITQADSYDER